jgi:ABC-type xylose transport system substrate-binding protein
VYADSDDIFKEGSMKFIEPLVNPKNIQIVSYKPIANRSPQIAFMIVDDILTANNFYISFLNIFNKRK